MVCAAKRSLYEIMTFHTYALLQNCFYIVTPFIDFVFLGVLTNAYLLYLNF